MQKTGIIALSSVAAMLPSLAQAMGVIKLAEPDFAFEGSLMTALKNRHSGPRICRGGSHGGGSI